jgi:hypothetical protein
VESRLLGFPYSVISMACFGNAFHKITITAFWEQEPLVRDGDSTSMCQRPSSPNREHLNAHSAASRNGLPYRCLSFEDRLSSDKTLPRYSVRAFLYSAMIRGFSLGPASA